MFLGLGLSFSYTFRFVTIGTDQNAKIATLHRSPRPTRQPNLLQVNSLTQNNRQVQVFN